MRNIRTRERTRKRWLRLAAVFLTVLTTAALCAFRSELGKRREAEQELALWKEKSSGHLKTVYVAAGDLKRGDTVTEESVYSEERYLEEAAEFLFSEEDFGKELQVNLQAGRCLYADMVLGDGGGELREVFVNAVDYETFIGEGDRIDVRIRYGNGEDYVVLADKRVLLCGASGGLVLPLTEQEILWVSSALTDRAAFPETRLYAVRYLPEEAARASRVGYLPREEILSLMGMEEAMHRARRQVELRIEGTAE